MIKMKETHVKTLVLRAFPKNNIDTVCSIQKYLNILHLLLTRHVAMIYCLDTGDVQKREIKTIRDAISTARLAFM